MDDSDYDHIKIKWNPPKKDGGAPITGYNVERKDPKSGRWIKVNKEPVFVSVKPCSHKYIVILFICYSATYHKHKS